jgi:hypothetical protein
LPRVTRCEAHEKASDAKKGVSKLRCPFDIRIYTVAPGKVDVSFLVKVKKHNARPVKQNFMVCDHGLFSFFALLWLPLFYPPRKRGMVYDTCGEFRVSFGYLACGGEVAGSKHFFALLFVFVDATI